MRLSEDGTRVIIDNTEYSLQGVPGHLFLHGSPTGFQDPQVSLPFVHHTEEPEDGGFNCYYQLAPGIAERYPRKGVLTPDALIAATIIKRLILTTSKAYAKKWYILPFYKLPYIGKKMIWVDLEWLADNCHNALERFYLDPFKACKSVRELWSAALEVIKDDGFTEDQMIVLNRIIMAVGLILEYDEGYRYRIQDIFGELDKKAFEENPGKEIARLFGIMNDRDGIYGTKGDGKSGLDGAGMKDRFKYIIPGINIALRVFPYFKEKSQQFVEKLDLDKVKLDDGDFYCCCPRYDYRYRDVPYPERLAWREKVDKETIEEYNKVNNIK